MQLMIECLWVNAWREFRDKLVTELSPLMTGSNTIKTLMTDGVAAGFYFEEDPLKTTAFHGCCYGSEDAMQSSQTACSWRKSKILCQVTECLRTEGGKPSEADL